MKDFFDGNNVFANSDKIAQLIVAKDVTPVTVYIELTNKCSFACHECDVPKGKDILDYDKLLNIIDELVANNVQGIVLTGGDPFLYPKIRELLIYLEPLNIDVGIETSAELIGSLSREIVKTCSWVKIPVETVISERFSVLRDCKGKRLLSILSNIKSLIDSKKTSNSDCDIILETKIDNRIPEIDKLIQWAINIGVDMVYIKSIRNKLGAITTKDIGRFLYLLEKSWYNKFKVSFDSFFNDANKPRKYKKCFGHFFKTYISSNGGIYTCKDHRNKNEYCYGNINQFSFSDIWDGMMRIDIIKNLNISKCPLHCSCDKLNKSLQILELKKYRSFL